MVRVGQGRGRNIRPTLIARGSSAPHNSPLSRPKIRALSSMSDSFPVDAGYSRRPPYLVPEINIPSPPYPRRPPPLRAEGNDFPPARCPRRPPALVAERDDTCFSRPPPLLPICNMHIRMSLPRGPQTLLAEENLPTHSRPPNLLREENAFGPGSFSRSCFGKHPPCLMAQNEEPAATNFARRRPPPLVPQGDFMLPNSHRGKSGARKRAQTLAKRNLRPLKRLPNKNIEIKKKTYTLLKEKFLSQPWANETLKTEIEKQFVLLESALNDVTNKELWVDYNQQKKLVIAMKDILRTEYERRQKASPFYCETCDRGFINNAKYSEHVSEHVTCGKQDCTFTAHPKVVEKHFLMQHRTGLFNRIIKGNTPEEIEKWVTERKRHFPTKDKIEEKKVQKEEMEKRGERYSEQKKTFNNRNGNYRAGRNNQMYKPNGKFNNFNSKFGHKGSNFKRNKFRSPDDAEGSPKKKVPPQINEEEEIVIRNLPPFRGTVYYQNASNSDDLAEDKPMPDTEEESLNSELHSEGCSDLESCLGDASLDSEDCVSIVSVENELSVNCVNETEKTGINVISELESGEPYGSESSNKLSFLEYNSEEECLDDSFKPANNVDDNNAGKMSDVNEKMKTRQPEDIPEYKVPSSAPEKIATCNNSLALLQCYDSDSEHENEIKENVDSDDGAPVECSSKPSNGVNDDGKTSESSLMPGLVKGENDENKKRKRRKRKDSNDTQDKNLTSEKSNLPVDDHPSYVSNKFRRYRPPTLLEKLLAQEIRHERNVILQCVRYVVQNNYFRSNENDSSATKP